MDKIRNRILTQRKFLRASEDSIGGAKALIIRRSLAKAEMHLDNLATAEGIFSTAESALMNISSIAITATDSVLQGANGTQGQEEKDIIATQLENLAGQMVSQINMDYAGRTLMGGTNTTTSPYDYNTETGLVTYNGADINSFSSAEDFPFSLPVYSDVGMGIKFDADGNVDSQTVLDISLNGADILGCGTDTDGDPLNLIALTASAATALREGDNTKAYSLIDKIRDATSTLTIAITDLGNKQQSVKYTQGRVKDNVYNLQVAQKSVEGIDETEEITQFKIADSAYNAILAMGSKVIPRSIFDFM
jgi:flagellar hook-associated protein 3 FlgL